MESFEPLVIGELVNRNETVPMAFGQAYCIRHRLPDHIGSKEIVPEVAGIKPLVERAYYGPRDACGGSSGNYKAKR